MKKDTFYRGLKRHIAPLALVLAMVIPMTVFAETADATASATMGPSGVMAGQANGNRTGDRPMDGRGRMNADGQGIYGLDTSTMTEAQKTAYDTAIAQYETTEDAVLAELVTAGKLTQEQVDAHKAHRAAQKMMGSIARATWTQAQSDALDDAYAKTGDERVQALQALVTAGQLTQEQADVLAAGEQSDLWQTAFQNDEDTALETALDTMRAARDTMQDALRDAGILGHNDNPGMGNRDGQGNQDRRQQGGKDRQAERRDRNREGQEDQDDQDDQD